jgi:hypothetical protein
MLLTPKCSYQHINKTNSSFAGAVLSLKLVLWFYFTALLKIYQQGNACIHEDYKTMSRFC